MTRRFLSEGELRGLGLVEKVPRLGASGPVTSPWQRASLAGPPRTFSRPEDLDHQPVLVGPDGYPFANAFPRFFHTVDLSDSADPAAAADERLFGMAGARWLAGMGLGAQFSVSTQQMARAAVTEAYGRLFSGTPNLATLQCLQALGAHEGSYGLGWKAGTSPVSGCPWSMVGSNNWGANQTKHGPNGCDCSPDGGLYTDSRPTSSGQQKYDWCYAVYATPADGATGMLRVLQHMPKVLAALPGGNLDEMAYQMRLAGYYQGFTTDKIKAASAYAAALNKQAAAIAQALGEPQVATEQGFMGVGPASAPGNAGAESSSLWWAAAAAAAALAAAAAAGRARGFRW